MTVNLEREAQTNSIASVGNINAGIEHPHGSVTVSGVGLPLSSGNDELESSVIFLSSHDNGDLSSSTSALETTLMAGGVEAKDANDRVSALVKLGSGDTKERESFAKELDELTKRAQTNSLTPEEIDWLAVIREVMKDPGVKKAFNNSASLFSGALGSDLLLLLLNRRYLGISAAMQTPKLKDKPLAKNLYNSRTTRITRLTLGCTAAGAALAACGGIAPLTREAPPAVQQGLTAEVAFKAMDTFSGQSIAGGKAGIEATRGGLFGDKDGRLMVLASSTDYKRQFVIGFTKIIEGTEQKTLLTVIEMKPDGTIDTSALLRKPPNQMQNEIDHREFQMSKLSNGIFNETARTLVVNRIGNGGTIQIFEENQDKSIDVTLLVDPMINVKDQKPQPTLPPPVFNNLVENQPSLFTSAPLATISLLALKFDLPTQQATEAKPTTAPTTAQSTATKPAATETSKLTGNVLIDTFSPDSASGKAFIKKAMEAEGVDAKIQKAIKEFGSKKYEDKVNFRYVSSGYGGLNRTILLPRPSIFVSKEVVILNKITWGDTKIDTINVEVVVSVDMTDPAKPKPSIAISNFTYIPLSKNADFITKAIVDKRLPDKFALVGFDGIKTGDEYVSYEMVASDRVDFHNASKAIEPNTPQMAQAASPRYVAEGEAFLKLGILSTRTFVGVPAEKALPIAKATYEKQPIHFVTYLTLYP